jgi:hypothetical protein
VEGEEVNDWFFIGTLVVLAFIFGFVGGVAWVWYIAGGPSLG